MRHPPVDFNGIQGSKKSLCQVTRLSEPVSFLTWRERSLAPMRGRLALTINFPLVTRDLVRRFNRYIFSIKYIMFFWRNCFGNIVPGTYGGFHYFARPFRGRISCCLSSYYAILRYAFLYRLPPRLNDPDYSAFCAPPVNRN
jgi:hypothetical protein